MDDRRAHFLTMLGDACVAASLADIPVKLLLDDGRWIAGTPMPRVATDESPPADETGYSGPLLIDGVATSIEDIVEFAVRTP